MKAFVALKPGYEPSEALKNDIMAHARKRLGAVVAPKEIDFLPSLPKTRSGKIMRRLLKARELGLPEGDISTLESGRTMSIDKPAPPPPTARAEQRSHRCGRCCGSAASRRRRPNSTAPARSAVSCICI